MTVITLMTDFGLKDGNVGVMKGVIWGLAPETPIADISHLIQPQDIREAALIFYRSAPYFPAGTIHIVVVDPGVGTVRRPMAARLGSQLYVGPDNGTITLLLEHAEQQGWPTEFVHLDQPQFWLPIVSHVFHGRDIFAPVAAHLARGKSLSEVGTPITDPVRLQLPQPEHRLEILVGEIIHIDHFGNVASNIRVEHLADRFKSRYLTKAAEAISESTNPSALPAIPMIKDEDWLHDPVGSAALAGICPTVRLGNVEIAGLVRTFGERPPGELVALLGSTGSLIVSVVNGSAAERLGIKIGDIVEVSVEGI